MGTRLNRLAVYGRGKEKAPRLYELIVLSDHGQSWGPTFKQRNGVTLKEFIEQHLPRDTKVAQSIGGDTGLTTLTATGAELRNVQAEQGGSVGRAMAEAGANLIDRGLATQDTADGRRNLHTDEVVGEDPLLPYAAVSGPGGPPRWRSAPGRYTRNSTDVFTILNGRRGGRVAPFRAPLREDEDWAPSGLLAGVGRVRDWAANLIRCVTLDRGGYERVADDPSMTGPATLIALVMVVLASVSRRGEFDVLAILAGYGAWWLATIIAHGAGLAVGGKGSYERTFRALGFAQGILAIAVLALFEPISKGVHLVALVGLFLSMWMGVAAAHRLRGWRTLLLPGASIVNWRNAPPRSPCPRVQEGPVGARTIIQPQASPKRRVRLGSYRLRGWPTDDE